MSKNYYLTFQSNKKLNTNKRNHILLCLKHTSLGYNKYLNQKLKYVTLNMLILIIIKLAT